MAKTYEVGDVIRNGDPEPVAGTPLLDDKGQVDPYDPEIVAGRWVQFLAWGGPFVVAPDYNRLVNGT